jgi:putative ABC transport system permease protein
MFGVAIMTEEGYDNYTDGLVHYNYSWKYKNTPKDKEEEINKSDVFLNSLNSQVEILNYIPRYSNQAINFAGDDMGGDKSMMIVLLYILIVIMAFVFGVTINNTIVKESMVIGTLRASGYTRGELLRHYISLPILTTLIASIVGNILGYTVIKDVCANLYYNSYSLTTYKTLWNSEAFLLTTVIPILIMLAINICIISYKLRMSPLKFIRNDLSSSKKKKAIKLPNFKFLSRYRIRVIIQNKSNYITLLIGIIFANILLLFGMMMKPLLHHFADESLNKMISDYQYVLKTPVETDTEGAEKYSVTSLETTDKKFKEEDITVYGITENSEYISEEIANDEIYVSSLYAEKYGLKKGSAIILKNEYNGEKFNFKISGIYDYPSSMAIFMSRDYFNNIFSKDTDYYNGYFTNNKLEDIDETYILSVIDENDMTKISRQMDKSMGGMMSIVDAFAIIMFAILIYLLTKLVIEKNSNSISMLKILGYNSGEISKIYLLSTTIVVIIATIISMFLATLIIKMLYVEIMSDMTGWIPFYIKYSIYPKMFAMGIGTYFVVLMLQYRRIRHISMSDALKNVE